MVESEQRFEEAYSYVLQFLRSAGWKVPIMAFIDEHCNQFDEVEENKLIYTDLFNAFKEKIDNILEAVRSEIGISEDQFVRLCGIGLKSSRHRRIFQQIIACDNFLSFKKLMIKRNKELEEEALKQLNIQGQASEQEVAEAAYHREQATIEHAVAVNLAVEDQQANVQRAEQEKLEKASQEEQKHFLMEKERDHNTVTEIDGRESPMPPEENIEISEEAKARVMEERKREIGHLPPIMGNRPKAPIDIPLEALKVEDEPMEVSPEEENLEERKVRLERERDEILARRKEERDKEMREYFNTGGSGPAEEGVSAEELRKRREIADRIKRISEASEEVN